jgi:ABC-type sugar transport system ATPase subunit
MNAGQGAVAELDQDLIISMMVGRAIENQFPKQAAKPGDVVLRVEDVRNARLKGCGFVLRRGEILGFGGLVGSGRTELMRAIFGLDESEGAVFLEDDRLARLSPSASLAKGIALVPEDRKEQGSCSAWKSVSTWS